MADFYDMGDIFARIEDYLIYSMYRNMTRHIGEEKKEGINWSQWQAEMLKGMREYKQRNAEIFKNQVYPEVEKRIEKVLWHTFRTGQSEQEAEILAAISRGFERKKSHQSLEGAFFKVNDKKMNALVAETKASMQKAEYAALRMSNDAYRQIIFGAQTFYNSGAGSLWRAVDMASRDFLNRGITCVTYSDGRRVNIASYAEMALRTANLRAYLHGEARKREEYGIHTVIVNRHNAACPMCVQWQGKVFIDDVWGGGTAAEAEQKGYPLLSEAIAGGLYHPNCKDGHTTYFEGVSKTAGPPSQKVREAQVKRYELQQEQRQNERRIRRYKRLYLGSVEESDRLKYADRLKKWQEKNNELISRYPKILRRSPEREKLREGFGDLGIFPPDAPKISVFAKHKESNKPENKPKIIIDVKPIESKSDRELINEIRLNAKLVTEKAKRMQEEAEKAKQASSSAEAKAKLATIKAEREKKNLNTLQANIKLRDNALKHREADARNAMEAAKKAHAEAAKLRAKAEADNKLAQIADIEARAAVRRHQTVLKMHNGGRLKVQVNTTTVKPPQIQVTAPNTEKISSANIQPVDPKVERKQCMDTIQRQMWIRRIPPECAADIHKMFNGMDNKRLQFWAKYGNLIRTEYTFNGVSNYNYADKTIHIYLKLYNGHHNLQINNCYGGYRSTDVHAILHESGHLMDDRLGIGKGLPRLTELLNNDFREYVKNLCGVDMLTQLPTPADIYKIRMDVTGTDPVKGTDSHIYFARYGVSDIIDGLTNGRIKCSYTHTGYNPGYWMQSPGMLEKEAVAEMFEAYMQGGEMYASMHKYFPRAMRYFESMINKL